MKKLIFLILASCLLTLAAHAQVTPGPSDVTTPPPLPNKPQGTGKVICTGQQITLNNDSISPAGWIFTWYKIAPDGSRKTSTITTSLYTETAGAAGWYIYQLMVTNPVQGCTSALSDPFKVYVAPALTVTVTSPIASACAITGNAILLTANVPAGYSYTYQWQRNGVNIAGATASTYNVTGEKTAGPVTFACNVSYDWGLVAPGNTPCSASGSKIITIVSAPPKPVLQ